MSFILNSIKGMGAVILFLTALSFILFVFMGTAVQVANVIQTVFALSEVNSVGIGLVISMVFYLGILSGFLFQVEKR